MGLKVTILVENTVGVTTGVDTSIKDGFNLW